MTQPTDPDRGGAARDPALDLARSLRRLEDPAFAALYAVLDELDAYVKEARWESRAIDPVRLDRFLTELRTRHLPGS